MGDPAAGPGDPPLGSGTRVRAPPAASDCGAGFRLGFAGALVRRGRDMVMCVSYGPSAQGPRASPAWSCGRSCGHLSRAWTWSSVRGE